MTERKFSVLAELANDLASPKVLPALFTGAINGTLLVLISVSFAAMIFSGDMAGFATRGAGLTLFGTGVMGVAVLLLSGIKCNVAITQDAPTATLVAATPIAATLLQHSGEAAFMTLTAILFLSSLVTGIAYLLIGRYQLANLFRFVPFPVVGGFLAGSGCLLIHGGIGVICGLTPILGNLHLFLSPEMLWKGVPGLVFALLLFILMQRYPHYLFLPMALVAGVAGYYSAFALSGRPLEAFRKSGLLISGVPDGGLWPVFSFDSLAAIHWELVFRHTPLALTVALISTLGMLLNTSGIEVAAAEDIDLNREFKTLGAANLVAGLGGSLPGYSALSLTMLGVKTGAVTRLCGVVSTTMVCSVLFIGGWLLTWFPTPLLGSLLVLLGLFFFWDWLVLTVTKMPFLDYLLILFITLTIVWKGFLPGVAVGMAATLMIFVFRFSRVSPIHAVFDLRQRHSRKQRSVPDRHLLAMEGESALGFELTGYLFFGSASAFVEQVRGRLADPVRLLFLDFRRVTGFDISADNNFQRLLQITAKAGIHTFLSHCPPALEQSLCRQGEGLLAWPAKDLESALERGGRTAAGQSPRASRPGWRRPAQRPFRCRRRRNDAAPGAAGMVRIAGGKGLRLWPDPLLRPG